MKKTGRRSVSFCVETEGGQPGGQGRTVEKGQGTQRARKLSSILIEYEKEKRKTVGNYLASSARASSAIFLRTKEEIQLNLQATLKHANLNELYLDVLSFLFPRWEDRENPSSKALLKFLENIFKMDSLSQESQGGKGQVQGQRGQVLHVEVVEGRGLPSKDANGLSDPYVTLHLSNKEHSLRTKVLYETLNPVWKETFKIPIKEKREEVLKIVIWDHDGEEKVVDRLKRVAQVKSKKAMGNLFREAFSHGRNSAQDFIGRIEIPLKEVSNEQTEKWYSLENGEGEGELYLILALGIEKDKPRGIEQFGFLYQLLIISQLEGNDLLMMVPFLWEHKYPPWGEYILRQLRSGWGLNPSDILLAKWISHVSIHSVFPLSGMIFPALTADIFENVRRMEYNTQQVVTILSKAEELVAFFIYFVEKIHEFYSCKKTLAQHYYILKTIEILLRPLEEVKLSFKVKSHLNMNYISTQIKSAIRKSALSSFEKLYSMYVKGDEGGNPSQDSDTIQKDLTIKIEQFLKLSQILNDDLKKGQEMIQKNFKIILGIDFHLITYNAYDEQFEKLIKPLVDDYLQILKTFCQTKGGNETELIANNFFKLYFALKQFAEEAPPENLNCKIQNSLHDWFYGGLDCVLDIFEWDWLDLMEKAVDKDHSQSQQSELVDFKGIKISSSAWDACNIISNIHIFWTNLSWPVGDQSNTILQSIIQRCIGYSISFAQLVGEKTKENLSLAECNNITDEFCWRINNISFVGINIREMALQLSNPNLDQFVQKQLEIQTSGLDGLINEILNLKINTLRPHILESLKKYILIIEEEGGKGNSIRKKEKAVEKALEIYGEAVGAFCIHLISQHLDEAIQRIWFETAASAKTLIFNGLKDHCPPVYFSRLESILLIIQSNLISASFGGKQRLNNETDLFKSLEIYGSLGVELKNRYFKARHEIQKECEGNLGMVALRYFYDETNELLWVGILNARQLKAKDSNGSSDPYCTLQLIPPESFPGIEKKFTKVQKENLYPIFDETFKFPLKRGMFEVGGGYLWVGLFDHDFIGKDDFLGEVYIPLNQIPISKNAKNLKDCPQNLLALTLPGKKEILQLQSLLGHLSWDREPAKFIKNEMDKCETV